MLAPMIEAPWIATNRSRSAVVRLHIKSVLLSLEDQLSFSLGVIPHDNVLRQSLHLGRGFYMITSCKISEIFGSFDTEHP